MGDGSSVGGGDGGRDLGSGAPGRIRRTWQFAVRHQRGIAAFLLVAGGFAGGFTVSAALDDDTSPDQVLAVTVDRPVVDAGVDTDASIAAPNVLGLTPDEARAVFVDAGTDPADITIVDVPAAGPSGIVVVQDPPAGAPAPRKVELGVSVAATVPDLVGQPADRARDRLDELGAQARVARRYDPAATEGTVLGSDPGPGQPLPVEVTLVVAAAPSSMFLSEIDAADGGCSDGSVSINGTDHDNALLCRPGRLGGDAIVHTWLIDRRIARFEATLGQDDETEPGAVLRFVIYGDGNVLAEGEVPYGTEVPVAVDLAGVLRFSISAVVVAEPDDVNAGSIVVGTPLLIGGPDDIDLLLAGGR